LRARSAAATPAGGRGLPPALGSASLRARFARLRGAIVMVALVAAGCASNLREVGTVPELDTQAAEVGSQYVIGEGDVLQINVWRQPELSVDDLVVRSDGKISIALVDDVQAAGLTPLELKEVLTERLSEYVTGLDVTVIVKVVRSKFVYMLGEVVREGPLNHRADMRVVDALAMAGGFRPFASKARVMIIRSTNGAEPVEFRFDYDDFVNGSNLEQNILLLPGDKVIVPEESPFWR
jgi:polysaccharide export outer membrane protein